MESKFTDKIGERERTLNKEFEKIQYDKKYEEFNELKQQMNRNINKILKKDSEENNLSTVTNNTQKNSKNTLNESNTKHTDFPDQTFRNSNTRKNTENSEGNFKKKSEVPVVEKKRECLSRYENSRTTENSVTEIMSSKKISKTENHASISNNETPLLSNTLINEKKGGKVETPSIRSKTFNDLSPISTKTSPNITNSTNQNEKNQNFDQTPELSVGASNDIKTTILESIKQFKYLDDKSTAANTMQNSFVVNSVNQFKIVKKCQKHFQAKEFSGPYKKNLSKNDKSQTLILDLDETLIHSEEAISTKKYDTVLTITLSNNRPQRIGLKLRPYCTQFLEKMSKKFELIIFTASLEDYANKVIDYIDPENKFISHRLFRQHCISHERCFIKDQRVINRRIEDMIIVDNLVYSFALQIDNGIPINTWLHDETDCEQLKLLDCLKDIRTYQDTRNFVRLSLRLNCFYNYLGRINDSNYASRIKY